jgi:hypothetical protein
MRTSDDAHSFYDLSGLKERECEIIAVAMATPTGVALSFNAIEKQNR